MPPGDHSALASYSPKIHSSELMEIKFKFADVGSVYTPLSQQLNTVPDRCALSSSLKAGFWLCHTMYVRLMCFSEKVHHAMRDAFHLILFLSLTPLTESRATRPPIHAVLFWFYPTEDNTVCSRTSPIFFLVFANERKKKRSGEHEPPISSDRVLKARST